MWYAVYIAAFTGSFILALAAVPVCRVVARRTGFLDVPKTENHKLHKNATPLLGGAAMFFAWAVTIAAGFIAAHFAHKICAGLDFSRFMPGMIYSMKETAVIILCAFAATLLGLFDDRHPLKAHTKFGGQFIIALAAVIFGGLRITLFIDTPFITIPVTVFWMLFIMNAMNFFDNMDGLAAGTACTAFVFFTLAAVVNEQYFVALLGSCSAGATAGFWIFNTAPASIFMGDSGSHFIGFLIGVISTKVTYYNPGIATTKFAVLIPLFILAVPIFDTFAVTVIRLVNHKPVYIGDHNHISHRFLHMGMSRKRAVQTVHLLALVCGLGAMPLLWGDMKTCTILFLQGGVLFLIMTLIQYAGKKES